MIKESNKTKLSFAVDTREELVGSSIAIKEYSVIEEKFGKKTLYTICGSDSNGSFQIVRRYSEFFILRAVLVERWPGFYVPKIPSKQVLGNLDPAFIEKRKKLLELFLKKISNLEYIYQSNEFQAFIRNTCDYKALVKTFDHMEIKTAEGIFKTFPRFLRNEIPENVDEKFIEAENIFKVALQALIEFQDQCRLCVESFDSFEVDLIAFIAEFREIGTVFTAKTSEAGNRESFFNPYVILLDWVFAEILDVESLIEAIETRYKYHLVVASLENKLESHKKSLTKIQSGKKTFSQYFSKKSKEDIEQKTQSEIEILEKNIQVSKDCHKIMSLRLLNKEIPMFKTAKLETYKHIMKVFSTASIQELTILVQQTQSLEFFLEST
ncbi:hypothetical protein SteCoe_1633 [Stentor coeruleus]|uniref:PX domain-containing protein n=1 Tax=Stentor coeruleus TaxID=5963 RepID=A0A1R2D1H5_9CILI|nr:hypothetical protein SteCoe_1633 [Stentor coeruleus]